MNRLNAQVSFQEVESAEAFAPAVEDNRPLYRENLIYLPFARHLSEEDEAAEQLGAAA